MVRTFYINVDSCQVNFFISEKNIENAITELKKKDIIIYYQPGLNLIKVNINSAKESLEFMKDIPEIFILSDIILLNSADFKKVVIFCTDSTIKKVLKNMAENIHE